MDSRSRIEAQVGASGTLRASLLSFFAILLSLLAAPSPIAALAPRGSYVPLVSLFLDGIKNGILPPGWHFIVSSSESLEIYVATSVVLALLLSSPMIAYQIMKFIVSFRGTRRTLYSLTTAASLLLASGVLFGAVLFSGYVFPSLTFCFGDCIFPPFIDAADFYLLSLGAIAAGAVSFTLPVYIYALVRFRR